MNTPVICVVDDDASVRRSLVRLIRSCGMSVEAHESAESYLAGHHDAGIACVILDVNLGTMSGIELHERIASEDPAPPVIFITAHDDEVTRERIRKCGAAGFLRKPFEDQALLSAIGSAMER